MKLNYFCAGNTDGESIVKILVKSDYDICFVFVDKEMDNVQATS